MTANQTVLAISGGVGGAKLALGLHRVLPVGCLDVLVNTGDDFRHLGLAVSPDLDTVLYTLAGVANRELGWGREDETWSFHEELTRLGGPTWFRLGDRDLAVHVERTARLASGEALSSITADLARRFGVRSRLLPMSDDPVRTMVDTDAGLLEFQEYFVRRHCEPTIRSLRYEGAQQAIAQPEVLDLLASPALGAVVVCPSNPFLSIEPILAIPRLREALSVCPAPVVAVSPVIGGRAVKGPTAKIMRELQIEVSPVAIAKHYAGIIDGLVLDEADAASAESVGVATLVTRTLMESLADREALAYATLAFAGRLHAGIRLQRAS